MGNIKIESTLKSVPKEESNEDKILEEDKGSNDTGMAQTSNEQKKDNLNKKEEEPLNSKIDIALESLSKEECKEGKILEEEKQSSDSNKAHTMINDSLKTEKIVTSKEMPSQDVIIS